jgi:hypothetical protein
LIVVAGPTPATGRAGAILGLKALTAYSEHARQMAAPGTATLVVDGKDAGTIQSTRAVAMRWCGDDLATKLTTDKNTIGPARRFGQRDGRLRQRGDRRLDLDQQRPHLIVRALSTITAAVGRKAGSSRSAVRGPTAFCR